jgi:hypothetical protein
MKLAKITVKLIKNKYSFASTTSKSIQNFVNQIINNKVAAQNILRFLVLK